MKSDSIFLPIVIASIFLFSFPNPSESTGWIFDSKKTKCGILFTGENYEKDKIEMVNPQVLNDLSAWNIAPPKNRSLDTRFNKVENWDKKLGSVKLYEGCKLKACEEPHLEGKCLWFNSSMPVLDPELKGKVSSAGCSCPIEDCHKAKCAKITLRQKECGRAFLEPSCHTCDGTFVVLKRNHEQGHLGGYENRIKSLVVNKGCKLTYYIGADFDEDQYELAAGPYDDFDATLGSYKCACDESEKPVVPTKPANPNYPPLMDFPSTDEGIQNLARRYPKHSGLDAALTSIRHKRSPRNAYILLIGLTGSGKSSTINFLFDNANISAVGGEKSTTEAIHEYRIPVQVDELGCKNCELRVIDTPGFGDTGGLEMDAKFLAGLETYLTNHEELRTRIPNIVLIFSKFTDNRFTGKSSSFVKTLRGIEYFKDSLFDFKYSNAIITLTHFMSEPKRIRKNPSERIRKYRETIEDYTLFPKPVTVVVGENRPEDQELAMVNGYYLLPNGEYYPQNLFEKIQESAEKGNDPIGEAIIRTGFKSPENFKVTEKLFPLKNVTFSREPFFLGELNARNFDIELTEVSNITDRVYEKQIKPDLKVNFPGTLQYVQRVLNLRSIFTKEQIPRTTVEILKLFKHIRQNELVRTLLHKAFDLQIPSLDIALIAGQSYNVLKDVVLPESPYNGSVKHVSSMGFQLPNIFTSSLINDQINLFNFQETKQGYATARLAELKVDSAAVKPELDTAWEIRPSYNTLDNFKKTGTVTVVKEYRLFQLTLNEEIKLKTDFIQRVKSIPAFDPANNTVVDDWKDFFAKYGTHVISSAYGGGAIQVEFKLRNPLDPKSPPAAVEAGKLAIKKAIEDFFKFLDDVYLGKSVTENDIDTTNVSYKLRFVGGDFQYAIPDFSRLTISQTSGVLNGFAESLEYQPAMLQTSLGLKPLSFLINKLDKELGYKVSNATASLLNAKLVYVQPPPPPPPLERPEVKKHIEELKAKLQENIDRLSNDLKASRETFEKFTREMVADNEKERQEMMKRLKESHRKTLESVYLNCVYEQANLKGDKICNAEQQTCVSIYMKSVRSVNTYNSCVQFFNGGTCTGTSYRHVSNETYNTKFPFDLSAGGRFAVLNC